MSFLTVIIYLKYLLRSKHEILAYILYFTIDIKTILCVVTAKYYVATFISMLLNHI